MKKSAKDKDFIKQPWYEGGTQALRKFISDNLVYPPEALAQRIEGTVFVKYDIDYRGDVSTAHVISALGYGCDEEAVRLVKMLKFKVEKPRGVHVLFHRNIQVHFRLPKAKELPTATFQYQYVAAKEKRDEPAKSDNAGSGYTFTISLG
jgi:protein TonB